MSVEIVNFGCRLNIAEGEAIRAAWTDGDAVIINSCAVTAEAERQARQAARKAARSGARVVATGCAVRLNPNQWSQIAEILPPRKDPIPAISGNGHARAFIEVQNGCDHDCTFCVTQIARGPSRSIMLPAIIETVQAAVARGQNEVVLTGVDVTSYVGGLSNLIRKILDDVPQLPRLRLSSLDPAEIDGDLCALLTNEPRIMPHVHLSLQSGDDMILKRMKRRHSRQQAISVVERLKKGRPEIAIGADLIAGFPTEDDAAHRQSATILEACDVVFAHIFPYSSRPGTAAARMPQVGRELAKARAATLREHAERRKTKWLDSQIGTQHSILVERDGRTGHAENFATIELATNAPPGTIMPINVTGHNGKTLSGVRA